MPRHLPIPPEGMNPRQNLLEAGRAWIEFQRERSSLKTIEGNEGYLRAPVKHFGDIPLRDFNIGLIDEYQRNRKAGPSAINHEISFLACILRAVDLWARSIVTISP